MAACDRASKAKPVSLFCLRTHDDVDFEAEAAMFLTALDAVDISSNAWGPTVVSIFGVGVLRRWHECFGQLTRFAKIVLSAATTTTTVATGNVRLLRGQL